MARCVDQHELGSIYSIITGMKTAKYGKLSLNLLDIEGLFNNQYFEQQ